MIRHDRLVAIKAFNAELTSGATAKHFLRDIRLAARLEHPNIVPVYDSGETDEMLYYVIPYVAGESLRARLRREGQLPLDDAVRIARDIAAALSYAHRRGIVHQSINPDHILLSHGRALVGDFGIARAVGGHGSGAQDPGHAARTCGVFRGADS